MMKKKTMKKLRIKRAHKNRCRVLTLSTSYLCKKENSMMPITSKRSEMRKFKDRKMSS